MKFALIFDMDGVVVDNFHFHEKAWKEFCRRHGLGFSEVFRTGIFGGTNRDHLNAFFGRDLTTDEISKYEQEKESIYRELYEPFIQPVKGLIPFLKALHEKNIPVALATSSPRINVDFVMQKTGVSQYIHTRLTAEDIVHGKPHPEIYLKAAAVIGINPDRCVVFEDSFSGIEAANAAGMKVIGLATTHTREELNNVDLVIDDLTQISLLQLEKLFIFDAKS
ncbi:MAG: HAD family phosphatase [Bacteroidetes bacterium]|nr:HAD family phosphatase [Bacteroidota bacterium]